MRSAELLLGRVGGLADRIVRTTAPSMNLQTPGPSAVKTLEGKPMSLPMGCDLTDLDRARMDEKA